MEKLKDLCQKTFQASFEMAVIILICMFMLMPDARAMQFDLGNDTVLDLDTTLIYGVGMRMKNPDSELLANINADDGNRSFKQYDLISNRLTARMDFDLQRNNIGLFTRVRAFYDDVYNRSNANDSPGTHNSGPIMGGPLNDHQDFTKATEDQQGKNVEFLDLFAYGDFELGDRIASFRIGRQVVSWGESLFTLGGISTAQSHADATMLNTPGAELKDIFLPSGQVLGDIEVFRNLTFSGYYQWEKHRSDTAGSFFSTMDHGDVGGYHLLAAANVPVTADRINDDQPRDDGQWGISLRYIAEKLNDTEFGLYYLNYHEKFPMAQTFPGAGTPTMSWGSPMLDFVDNLGYNLAYQEDIKLYGVSFSTTVGDTNVSGELSYRKDYLIPVKDSSPTNLLHYVYKPFDVAQVLVSGIHNFGPLSFVDDTMLMFEVGMNQVIDGENLFKDKFAWGSMTSVTFSFFEVLPFLTLKIPVSFKHRPQGISSLPGTFTEKQHSVSIGTTFVYKGNLEWGLKYTDFLGDAKNNPSSDRDNLAFSIKYTF